MKGIRRRLQDFDKENVEVQREIGKVKNEMALLNRSSNTEIRNLATRLIETLNKVHYFNFFFRLIFNFTIFLSSLLIFSSTTLYVFRKVIGLSFLRIFTVFNLLL